MKAREKVKALEERLGQASKAIDAAMAVIQAHRLALGRTVPYLPVDLREEVVKMLEGMERGMRGEPQPPPEAQRSNLVVLAEKKLLLAR